MEFFLRHCRKLMYVLHIAVHRGRVLTLVDKTLKCNQENVFVIANTTFNQVTQ